MKRRIQTIKIRRTTIIFSLSIAVLAGIELARFTLPIDSSWVVGTALVLILIWRLKAARVMGLLVFMLLLGWWRGGQSSVTLGEVSSAFGERVTVHGVVVSEASYADRGQKEIMVRASLIETEQVLINLEQPVLLRVRSFRNNAMQDDEVRVSGKLYPLRGRAVASISFAEVEVVGRKLNWLTGVRRNFEAGVRNSLPEPAASLGIGLLTGAKSGLGDTTTDALRQAGLAHIVAVSGYNVTIIMRALFRMLKGRVSKFHLLALCGLSLWAFVTIAGSSPSLTRAAIVVTLSLMAWSVGRTIRPGVLIGLAAAVSGVIEPLYVWRDVGWWLSFSAFWGVLVLAPLLRTRVSWLFGWLPRRMRHIASETLGAVIATWPVSLTVFGTGSAIGLITNLITGPILPIAMLTTFLAGVVGWLLPIMAGIVGLPAELGLIFILDIASIASRLPGAIITLPLPFWGAVSIYAFLILGAWLFMRQSTPAPFVNLLEYEPEEEKYGRSFQMGTDQTTKRR